MAPGELLYHVQTQPLKLSLAFAKLCNDHSRDAKNELLMSTKHIAMKWLLDFLNLTGKSFTSYLSQISYLSCGEISEFCKEFEQLMEFYRN